MAEKLYFVTGNVTFKLSKGKPAVISDNRVVSDAVPPVSVTLPRLMGGSEGYTVARVRKLAEMNNSKEVVDALSDKAIETALDALMARSPSVWNRADYIERTKGKDAANMDKRIETLSEENKRLKEEMQKMQDKLQRK